MADQIGHVLSMQALCLIPPEIGGDDNVCCQNDGSIYYTDDLLQLPWILTSRPAPSTLCHINQTLHHLLCTHLKTSNVLKYPMRAWDEMILGCELLPVAT